MPPPRPLQPPAHRDPRACPLWSRGPRCPQGPSTPPHLCTPLASLTHRPPSRTLALPPPQSSPLSALCTALCTAPCILTLFTPCRSSPLNLQAPRPLSPSLCLQAVLPDTTCLWSPFWRLPGSRPAPSAPNTNHSPGPGPLLSLHEPPQNPTPAALTTAQRKTAPQSPPPLHQPPSSQPGTDPGNDTRQSSSLT